MFVVISACGGSSVNTHQAVITDNMTSREVKVLEKYFLSLCSAVSDPLQLARELYTEKLIAKPQALGLKESEEGRESPTSKRHQAAIKLLTAVDMALSKDATLLRGLIDILKYCLNDNGIAAEYVRAMEIDYTAKGEEYVSIQHARMVLVKHMNNVASVMSDVSRIGEELVSMHIVSDQKLQEVRLLLPLTRQSAVKNNPEIMENAQTLIRSVQNEVKHDPRKFAVLIGVLKDNSTTDQNVVALMEAEYCELVVVKCYQAGFMH